MRYAALNQGGDDLASYNDFVPAAAIPGKMPPPGENLFGRYSDEQLYALARFAPSLVPHPIRTCRGSAVEKELVERGEKIFHDPANRCATCHDPKQGYSNQMESTIRLSGRGETAIQNGVFTPWSKDR